MASLDVSSLKKNTKIEIDGHPYVVVDFQFVKPGKGQGLYKCRIKNMITGAVMDRTWRSGEQFEPANVESKQMQYLFAGSDSFTFMDNESYEQVELSASVVGDDKWFLLDNLTVDVLFYNDRPVGLSLPSHVTMEITDSEPGVKGDTATNVTKQATTSTGYQIGVPIFIKIGERIKVDTRTGTYIERVNA